MHNLAAFLLDPAKLNPLLNVFGAKSYLLFKFNLSARQQIFSGSCFTFWNRPYAVIFASEKRSAGMRQQNFYFVILPAKHKQTGADSTPCWH